jgi:hypothetical protein
VLSHEDEAAHPGTAKRYRRDMQNIFLTVPRSAVALRSSQEAIIHQVISPSGFRREARHGPFQLARLVTRRGNAAQALIALLH